MTVLESEDDKTQAERKFNGKKWGTVFNTEVAKLYKDKARSFFNPNEICKACLFVKNNKEVKMLSSLQTYDNIVYIPSVFLYFLSFWYMFQCFLMVFNHSQEMPVLRTSILLGPHCPVASQ